MENYNPALAVYSRDSSLPYWQNNVATESVFDAFSYGPERAQAWLRYRNVSETSIGFQQAVMMRGHFEGGILGNHTYHWTFTPGRRGDLAIIVPVQNDFVAMSRHDHTIWGCITGHGQYAGSTATGRKNNESPLRVYKTPINWLRANCEGILPLSKSFFPQLQHASCIIAEGYEHACELEELVFMAPAERLFLDCDAAEQSALKRIAFEVAA
jgi:hypothetical protein